jgi:hypothetical protein
MGEFSPNGRLFPLGSFFHYCRSPNFWLLVFLRKSYVLTLTKNVLGYILGDFLIPTHLVTLNPGTFLPMPAISSISRKHRFHVQQFVPQKRNSPIFYGPLQCRGTPTPAAAAATPPFRMKAGH